MINRFWPHRRLSLKALAGRLDRVAGELNILLVVIAIGLAALDATFLVAQAAINHLPPITRISYDDLPQRGN